MKKWSIVFLLVAVALLAGCEASPAESAPSVSVGPVVPTGTAIATEQTQSTTEATEQTQPVTEATQPATEATEPLEPWGSDEYQQMLPEPPPYTKTNVTYNFHGPGVYSYSVRFDYNSDLYDAFYAYGQELIEAGYCYCVTEQADPYERSYRLEARNEDGVWVSLWAPGGIGEEDRAYVTLFPLESEKQDTYFTWEVASPVREHLPDPGVENYRQDYLPDPEKSADTDWVFHLYGMNYEAAESYVQALQDMGYIAAQTLECQEGEYLTYEARNYFIRPDPDHPGSNWLTPCAVKLIFKANQTDPVYGSYVTLYMRFNDVSLYEIREHR